MLITSNLPGRSCFHQCPVVCWPVGLSAGLYRNCWEDLDPEKRLSTSCVEPDRGTDQNYFPTFLYNIARSIFSLLSWGIKHESWWKKIMHIQMTGIYWWVQKRAVEVYILLSAILTWIFYLDRCDLLLTFHLLYLCCLLLCNATNGKCGYKQYDWINCISVSLQSYIDDIAGAVITQWHLGLRLVIIFISQDELIFLINQNKIQSPGSYLQMSCLFWETVQNLCSGAFTGPVLPRDVITRFYTIPLWLPAAEVLQLNTLQLEKKPGRMYDINTHSDPTGRRTHPTTSICILNIPYPRGRVAEQHRRSVI